MWLIKRQLWAGTSINGGNHVLSFQMVGFGKKLRELQNPEWEPYYINYKMMKKKLKIYVRAKGDTQGEGKTIRKEFLRMLDWQIERIVLFLLERQGHLAARLSILGEERELVKESGDTSRVDDCIEAYRDLGTDLLKLLYFVEINATGLRKILKKYDKQVAYRLTDYYVASRSNHPYSQLQQVFRHVGIGAMVGALSHSLAELQNQTKSIYDEPAGFSLKEPVIDAIKAAEERLTNSTSFFQFIGTHALIVSERELPTLEAEIILEQYNITSLILNLANTFLYMVNTYIIVPSADKYAISLGAAPTLCGVIIGSMAVAQLVSSVYFSAWSNKSYYRPLIFSSVVLLFGNVLYALAYDMGSLPVLIIGRVFCGLGSARAVNRRYISDWVPVKKRLQASAAFVSASALGMAIGPAFAGFFEVDKTFLRLTLNSKTLPGWVMAACWCSYLVCLFVGFKEPSRGEQDTEEHVQPATVANEDNSRIIVSHGQSEDILIQPLLESNTDDYKNDSDPERESSEDPEDSNKPAKSLMEAYRLLTTPVKVQLLIYFMLKYAMEVLLSESSVVTAFYFEWTTRPVAIFLALLGLTVLPVNILVGTYISNMFEDRQILVASEIITCIGVIISFVGPFQYSVAQYVSGALITFVAAEVLEGVNLSLLSKVMSARLAQGTYNNGLLSTEAGTLARVIADGTITLAGYFGTGFLLNLTLAPTLLLGIVSLIATFYCYNSLF